MHKLKYSSSSFDHFLCYNAVYIGVEEEWKKRIVSERGSHYEVPDLVQQENVPNIRSKASASEALNQKRPWFAAHPFLKFLLGLFGH